MLNKWNEKYHRMPGESDVAFRGLIVSGPFIGPNLISGNAWKHGNEGNVKQ